MNNFLDKVGLQHFVEKIKSLLSGYLPLSGGDISGALQQTVHEGGAEINTTLDKGFTYYYSTITPDNNYIGTACEIGMNINGIVFNKNVSTTNDDNIYTQAYFDTEKCNTKKFVLSGDSNQGLIANNSETVVKELSEEKISDMVLNNASLGNGKYYMSGDSASSLITALKYNDVNITIVTTEDASFTEYISGNAFTIPANTNYIMSKNIFAPATDEDNKKVKSLICKGPIVMSCADYINLETFDGSATYLYVQDELSEFFSNCTSLESVKINNWNTNEITSLQGMFNNCEMLKTLDLSNWDTHNVTDTSRMFNGCTRLTTLNLSGWNMQNVENMSDMFKGCSGITELILDEGFGRMKDSVGTVDFSMMTKWVNDPTFQSLMKLYDRASNNMGGITLKLPSNTIIPPSIGQSLMTKGYTVVK